MNDNPFLVTDEGAARILRDLKADIEARRAAQLRYERTLRGRAARLLGRVDWFLVSLIVMAILLAALNIYAGYVEASAPLPPVESP